MIQFTPQAKALGMEVTKIEPARVWGLVPYREELIGDPETGVIAGGVITTFLDTLCGTAAVAAMEHPTTVATIDLRIDYMRPATPKRDVLAEAHCYKLGKSVAFVRAVAYDDTPDNPIAHVAAAFMVNSNNGRKFGANLRTKKS
ncbi:MAG: PaaI family thioesterase [Alphaproteobacteria bacterium]|nr:PaaI family thioesterase [Alphaproteobacteria bacterium]